MFESRPIEILLGNSIPLPEEDLDDYDSDYHTELEALREYYFQVVVDAIGQEDFKQQFMSVFYKIQEHYDYEKQRMLCFAMLKKFYEIQDFEFPENIDFADEEEVEAFYEFIKFYEYNNENYISRIWLTITNTFPKNIESFCKKNENNIMQQIEEQIESFDFNGMIVEFLRTNTRQNIIDWFCKKSEKIKIFIKYQMERKKTNG